MGQLSQLRKDYDIQNIVERMGYQTRGNSKNRWCVCPLPQHHHSSSPSPSFSIFWMGDRQFWKCHGQCGLHGDVIDLVGFMSVPGYRHEDFDKYKAAAQMLAGGRYRASKPTPPPPEPLLPAWAWEKFLPISDEARKYAHERGLTDELIEKHKIGSATRIGENGDVIRTGRHTLLSLPTFHAGSLWGIKLRKMVNDQKYKYFSYPGSRKGLFNMDAVNQTEQAVLVVKGEIAAMVCEGYGFLACAPTGGEGSDAIDIQKALALSRPIVVGDNDQNPDTRAKMTQAAARRAAVLGALIKFPWEQYKGVDDWLLAEPEDAVRMIQSWLEEA